MANTTTQSTTAELDMVPPGLASFSCACSAPTHSAESAQAALAEVQRAWNAAASHWNIDAFVGLYDEKSVLFGGRQVAAVGSKGIREYFASYDDVLRSVSLVLVEQNVFEVAPSVIVAQGFGKFHFVRVDGSTSRTVLRTSWCIVKHATHWKILQHHFSAIPEAPPIPQ